MIKYFTATKAFLKRDGKILLLRESSKYADGVMQGKYDVPGGRLDPHEEVMDGLNREILEESGLKTQSAEEFYESDIIIPKKDEEWHIRRIFFACDALDGDVILSDDHDDFIWINPEDYSSVPIVENLKDVFEAYLLEN